MCTNTVAPCDALLTLSVLQDFCYLDSPDTFNVIDAINMCVTVIVYDCDSVRGLQMLVGGAAADAVNIGDK